MSDEDTRSWVFVGGLPFELTEGDVICVFSQYGEVAEINLVRDRETGKSRGFGFVKYEDSRSCELAVDNLSAATIVGRKITVDYSKNAQAIKKKRPLPPLTQEPEDSAQTRLLPIQDIRFDRGDEKAEADVGDRHGNEVVKYRRRDSSEESRHNRSRHFSRSKHRDSRTERDRDRDRYHSRSPSSERRSHRRHRSRSHSPRRHKKSSHSRSSPKERRRKKEKKSRHRRSSSSERSHHRKHKRHH